MTGAKLAGERGGLTVELSAARKDDWMGAWMADGSAQYSAASLAQWMAGSRVATMAGLKGNWRVDLMGRMTAGWWAG